MTFQLVIPTHGRVHRQVTLKNLPAALKKRTILVTSTRKEGLELITLYGKEIQKVVYASDPQGIAAKRHWIMKNIEADFIFMMDDDMRFSARCSENQRTYVEGRWQVFGNVGHGEGTPIKLLPTATEAQVLKGFKELERMAGSDRYTAIGLSSRMGNDKEPNTWKDNTRLMHAFGIRRETYLKEKLNFGDVKQREDMHIALSLLERGYENRVYFDMSCDPGAYGAPGGCSSERTVEISNMEAERLAALHPGLVRIVDRDYQGTPRKEVVCSWKKALKK